MTETNLVTYFKLRRICRHIDFLYNVLIVPLTNRIWNSWLKLMTESSCMVSTLGDHFFLNLLVLMKIFLKCATFIPLSNATFIYSECLLTLLL